MAGVAGLRSRRVWARSGALCWLCRLLCVGAPKAPAKPQLQTIRLRNAASWLDPAVYLVAGWVDHVTLWTHRSGDESWWQITEEQDGWFQLCSTAAKLGGKSCLAANSADRLILWDSETGGLDTWWALERSADRPGQARLRNRDSLKNGVRTYLTAHTTDHLILWDANAGENSWWELQNSSAASPAETVEACEETGDCGPDLGPGYHWPVQKGNLQRTGLSPHVVERRFQRPPSCVWRDPHLDVIRSTPLIDDQMNIYFSTLPGRVYKLSPDCKVLWMYFTGGARGKGGISMVPTLYRGHVIILTKSAWLIKLAMETGLERFTRRVATKIASDCYNVFAENGTFILPAVSFLDMWHPDPRNTVVMGLRASSGETIWSFAPDAPVYNFQACSAGDGTVVFQDQSGGVYRLGIGDGRLIWRSGIYERHYFTTGATVIENGLVLVASNLGVDSIDEKGGNMGLLHTYNFEDGKPRWAKALPYLANQAVAIGRLAPGEPPFAVIGIGSNPNFAVPLRPELQFLPEWLRYVLHWFSLSFPKLFSPPMPRATMAFDVASGRELWRYEMEKFQHPATAGDNEKVLERLAKMEENPDGDPICLPDACSQPIVSGDGTAYVGWEDGRVYAVRDDDRNGEIDEKSEVSTYDFGDGFQGSLAIGPGMLAVVPCGGGVYVWKS